MLDRPLIRVAGPPGAGKTALIEALLGYVVLDVACVRAIRDSSLRQPKESRPRQDPELKRYRAAGAYQVCVYRFPSSQADAESFYETEFMADFCEAVLIEGDNPTDWLDLAVFVAPPPSEGETLLCRGLRNRERERLAELDRIEKSLSTPEDAVRLLLAPFGDAAVKLALQRRETVERIRTDLAAHVKKMRAAPPLEPTEHWAISPRFAGIENAQVVVVNVRGDRERAAGESLLEEIARIRKDPEVLRDVLGPTGHRIPITAVVADLTDRRDPGLKKALRRIRRVAERARA